MSSSLSDAANESHSVGEGPEYEEVRAAVRKLLPLFGYHGGPAMGSWGCGMIDMLEPAEEGHQAYIVFPVASRWERQRNAITRNFDVGMIRATGLALLAYAEAADGR